MPRLIRPMLAVPGELPTAAEDAHWRYEMKWDGVRAVGYVGAGEVRLLSRNRLSLNGTYPEIVDALAKQDATRFVMDGEIVAFAGRRTSFARSCGIKMSPARSPD